MKTILVNNITSVFGPSQGSGRLLAYLKNKGHDVEFKDLNQEAYFGLLSEKNLRYAIDKLKYDIDTISRSKYLRQDYGSILLNNSNKQAARLLSKATGSEIDSANVLYALMFAADYIISEINSARDALYNQFLRLPLREFFKHFQTILCGKAIIDAAYFPAQMDFGLGFYGTAYAQNAHDLISSVTDESHNFLIHYYREEVLPALLTESPSVIGISVTHSSEFVPAFTLASMIKSQSPDIHITLGGAVITEIAYKLCKIPELWQYFDSLVLGPGELPFSFLLENIENNRSLTKVPDLIYKEKGSILTSERHHEFDLNDSCTPEYVSVRPGSVLPLETSSGCYWGKCIFCYYPMSGTANDNGEYSAIRVRDIDAVCDDLTQLQETYAPTYIGITDSALSPKRIEQIAEYNLKTNNQIKFTAFLRFEKEFKSLSLCQRLSEGGFLGTQVGLESGSKRINRLINKGIDLEDAVTIIDNFHKSDILVHLYTIVGLPGETFEESQDTFSFIMNLKEKLTLDWQIYPLYVLEKGALNSRSDEFGIKAYPVSDEILSQLMMYELEDGMSQNESMATALSFTERLERHTHILHEIMDVESYKIFLLAQRAKQIMPDEVETIYVESRA